jgi:hypothetical protein
MATQEYVLVNRERLRSQINSGYMYRLTWVCLEDFSIWEMIVDEEYRNYLQKGWRNICTRDRYWGVYQNLHPTTRTSKQGYGVLNADHAAECIIPIDSQSMACDVIITAKAEYDRITADPRTAHSETATVDQTIS